MTKLQKMEDLFVQGNKVDRSYFPLLLKFPKLKSLTVSDMNWSESDRQTLKRMLPHCELYSDYEKKME